MNNNIYKLKSSAKGQLMKIVTIFFSLLMLVGISKANAAGPFSFSAVANNISCFGGSDGSIQITDLGGQAPFAYTISPNVGNQFYPGLFTDLPVGTYVVTGTDANNATFSVSVAIAQPATPVSVTITVNQPTCFGNTNGSFVATGSGGTKFGTFSPIYSYVYDWYDSATNTQLNFDSTLANIGVSSSSYYCIVEDLNGCRDTAKGAIMVQPAQVTMIPVVSQILCNGEAGSVALHASGGVGTITTSPSNINLLSGTYTFTATDANGCNTTTSVTINTQPTAVSITASAGTILCNNGTANISLSASGGNGAIATSPTNTNLSAGTYTFTATDANGCTSTVSATLINPALLVATVTANSPTIISGNALILTVLPTGLTNYNVAGPGSLNVNSATNIISTIVNVSNTGVFTVTVTNANGCAATTTVSLVVTTGLKVALKTFLSGPYVQATGLMWDSLRYLNVIPTTEPYSAAPYNNTYLHVNGGGGETVAASIFTVTGNNAIVDWVFVQLRSKLDSNIVTATRCGLIQRDGDIVDVDGVSPLFFATSAPDQYFISIEHRNHLGIMTKGKFVLSLSPVMSIDLTTTAVPLFSFAGRAGNSSPLSGSTRIIGGVRTMYAGNCNLDIAAAAYRYITYNNTNASDRYAMLMATGGTSTINGYSIFDIDMNGYARFNGLNPDRLIMMQNTANSNTLFVNEQTPN
jgi:hypothetical protein